MGYEVELFDGEDGPLAVRVAVETLSDLTALIESRELFELGPVDEHGELTARVLHDGQPVDLSVLTEHVPGSFTLNDKPPSLDEARNGNPRRRT